METWVIPSAPSYVVVETEHSTTTVGPLGVKLRRKTWTETVYPCSDINAAQTLAKELGWDTGGEGKVTVMHTKPKPRWRTTVEVKHQR